MGSIIPLADLTSEITGFCAEQVSPMDLIGRIAYSPIDILRRVPVAQRSLLGYSEFRFRPCFRSSFVLI